MELYICSHASLIAGFMKSLDSASKTCSDASCQLRTQYQRVCYELKKKRDSPINQCSVGFRFCDLHVKVEYAHMTSLGTILSFCLMIPFMMPLIVFGLELVAWLLLATECLSCKSNSTELIVLSIMMFSIFCINSIIN